MEPECHAAASVCAQFPQTDEAVQYWAQWLLSGGDDQGFPKSSAFYKPRVQGGSQQIHGYPPEVEMVEKGLARLKILRGKRASQVVFLEYLRNEPIEAKARSLGLSVSGYLEQLERSLRFLSAGFRSEL